MKNSAVTNISDFESFSLKGPLLQAVTEAGFTTPSPIQAQVIPVIMQGHDVIAQAATGTGKTAAFGLPALNRIQPNKGVDLLVITPTRELAQQVSDQLFKFGRYLGVKTTTVYGGQSSSRQIEAIRKGCQVVVATPGRLLDLMSSGNLGTFAPSIVVLDEADEMLDMGFLDDIQKIFTLLPKKRQTLLFSATMPAPILNLAEKFMKTPEFVKAAPKESGAQDIKQLYYVIKEHEREPALFRLFDTHSPDKSIIFCGTKREVDRLSNSLIARGRCAKGLHGDMEQNQRQQVISAFRRGEIDTLVATDVAARGLDVADVSHVFNYNIPFGSESYVHRIGRTGRAGKKGVAMTLITPRESRDLRQVIKTQGSNMVQAYIPSLEDVKKSQSNRLVEQVKGQVVDPDAKGVLKALEKVMDSEAINLHLISLLLERQMITGPATIGFNSTELDSLFTKGSQEEQKGRARKPFRKKPFTRGSKPFSKAPKARESR